MQTPAPFADLFLSPPTNPSLLTNLPQTESEKLNTKAKKRKNSTEEKSSSLAEKLLSENDQLSSSSLQQKKIKISQEKFTSFHEEIPFPLPVLARSSALIPSTAGEKLSKWLKNNPLILSENRERISYHETDIPEALKTFQEDYSCSWHVMKKQCTDSKTLQIINDLRSAYLKEIFEKLQGEFNGVLEKISDFGSDKLTSDRDFAFQVGAHQQTKEADIVHRFNEIFEREWNLPSAIVFDSNAYTMQYLLSAKDPEMESRRSNLQNEGSLLMKLRTSTPQSWATFQAESLNRITDSTLRKIKSEEFAKVESQNAQLENRLNKEILGKYLTKAKAELNLDTLSDDHIAKMVARIKQSHPHIVIEASNALNKKFKTEYQPIEEQRNALFSTLNHLEKIANTDSKDPFINEFATLFNSQASRRIIALNEAREQEQDPHLKNALQTRISLLKNCQIQEKDAKETMEAFKTRADIEKNIKDIHQYLVSLENQASRYQLLDQKLHHLESQLSTTLSIEASVMNKTQAAIHEARKELTTLQQSLGATHLSEIPKVIANKKQVANAELQAFKKKELEAFSHYGELWDKAGALSLESDRMLIQMQQCNLKGMCFAQEAHVSEGAFALVVLHLQAGETGILTPNQYVQAFREISGYYSGHQMHQSTSYGKAIESSKYADRLIKTIGMIQERASALNVEGPALEDLSQLSTFFEKIIPLRGPRKNEAQDAAVTKAARLAGLIATEESFDEKTMQVINTRIDSISASLEAWLANLPKDSRRAYYSIKPDKLIQ